MIGSLWSIDSAQTMVATVSTLVSVVALGTAVRSHRQLVALEQTSHRELLDLERRMHDEMVTLARQDQLTSHLERMRTWADAACDLSVRALRCTRASAEAAGFTGTVAELRTELSAHADKGRWLFPNLPSHRAGDPSLTFRQKPVEILVGVFTTLDGLDHASRHAVRKRLEALHGELIDHLAGRLYANEMADRMLDLTKAEGYHATAEDDAVSYPGVP